MAADLIALLTPAANRVYGQHTPALAAAELRRVLNLTHAGLLESIENTAALGVPALRLRLREDVTDADDAQLRASILGAIARSAHVMALFSEIGRMPAPGAARDGDLLEDIPDLPVLLPVPAPNADRLPSDLLTILKYPGKTNELFTALMLNLALAASADRDLLTGSSDAPAAAGRAGRGAASASRRFTVLDPVAGRGTTLNQAAMWGLDAIGVDVDKKDAELYRGFLTAWLRDNRFKHTTTAQRLTLPSGFSGASFSARFARSKQEQKDGLEQHITLHTADTAQLGSFIPQRTVHAVVADLPYGVQHGARTKTTGAKAMLHRSPLGLLDAALPAWTRAMTAGASLVIAINRHTAPWPDAARALEAADLRVLTDDGEFRHRVDRSIDRDIIVAVKSSRTDLS